MIRAGRGALARTTGSAALVGALAVAVAARAEEAAPPADPERPQVALEQSFRADQEAGRAITHMPAVLFTPDGERLIGGTSTGEVIVWDAASRAVLSRERFADAAVEAIAVDPRGESIVALMEDGALRVIAIATGEVRAEVTLKDATPACEAAAEPPDAPAQQSLWAGGQSERQPHPGALALVPGDDAVVVARGRTIEVRALPGLEPVHRAETGHSRITGLAVAPAGDRLATVGEEGGLVVRGLAEALPIVHELKKNTPLYAVAFAPDGESLAFGGHERVITELALASGEERTIAQGQPYWITSLGYGPDGDVLAVGDESCDVWVFAVESRERLFHSKHHVECWLTAPAWSPDGERLLFGCRPNRHHGTPQVFVVNVAGEVGLCPDVQAARAERAAAALALQARYEAPENQARIARVRALQERQALLAPRPNRGAAMNALESIAGGTGLTVSEGSAQQDGAGAVQVYYEAVELFGEGALPGAPFDGPQLGLGSATLWEAAALAEEALVLQALEPDAVIQMTAGVDASDLPIAGGNLTVNALRRQRRAAALADLRGQPPLVARLLRPHLEEARRRALAALEEELRAAQAELAALPDVAPALEELRAADEVRRAAEQEALEALRGSFNVNEWRLKR